MVASTQSLEDLGVNHPANAAGSNADRQQHQQQHLQERYGHAYRSSAQTAQDKRSRLSNVINNLRKKVPDGAASSDSPRKEEDDRSSVERNLETLEKYVMTVLNGVIKDNEEEDKNAEKTKELERQRKIKSEPSSEGDIEAAVVPRLEDSSMIKNVEDEFSETTDFSSTKETIEESLQDSEVRISQDSKIEEEGLDVKEKESSEDDRSVSREKESRTLSTIIMDRLSEHQVEERANVDDGRGNRTRDEHAVSEDTTVGVICGELLDDLLSDIYRTVDDHENLQKTEECKKSKKTDVTESRVETKDSNISAQELPVTGLHCSLPLDKVASVLQNCQSNELITLRLSSGSSSSPPSTQKPKPSSNTPPVRVLCLYCDRKFLSMSRLQRHTEKAHQLGGGRRSERNLRKPSQNCQYCCEKSADTLETLFQHMVASHGDKYHACVQCLTRYLTREALVGHISETHGGNAEKIGQVQPEKIKEGSPPNRDFCSQNLREKVNMSSVREKRSEEKESEDQDDSQRLDSSRTKLIATRESIDNPASPEFDSSFYSNVSCNIRENLLHHLDGKLQTISGTSSSTCTSPIATSSSTATTTESKSPQQQPQQSYYEHSVNQIQFPIDISLTAATPVYSKDYSASEEYENSSEHARKPGKMRSGSRPRRVSFEKYNFPRKYDGREQWTCSIKDLSKFDISTQLTLRKKQQLIKERLAGSKLHQTQLKSCEITEVSLCEQDQIEPVEIAVRDEDNTDTVCVVDTGATTVDVHCDVGEPLPSETKKETTTESSATLSISTEFTVEFADFMRLRRREESDNGVTDAQEIVYTELSGEWSRMRIYICGACGSRHVTLKEMEDHKAATHPRVLCSHFDLAGDQREYYTHLYLPGRDAPTDAARNASLEEMVCTKCAKSCPNVGELHRHMLECGGDQAWLLGLTGSGKKKCKWRPFGSRSRRRRQRGMKRNIQNSQTQPRIVNAERSKEKQVPTGPRVRPSDRESIQKMLANLPAKRATRKVLQDNMMRSQGRLRNVQTRTRPCIIGDNSSRISRNKAALRNKLLKNAKSIQRNRCRSDNIAAVIESVVRKCHETEKKLDSDVDKTAETENKDKKDAKEMNEGSLKATSKASDQNDRTIRPRVVGRPKVLGKKRNVKNPRLQSKSSNKLVKTLGKFSKFKNDITSETKGEGEEASSPKSTPKNAKMTPKAINKNDVNINIKKISTISAVKNKNKLTQNILKKKRPVDPVASMNASIKAKSQLRTQDDDEKYKSADWLEIKPKLKAAQKLKKIGVQLPRRITRLSSDSDKMPTLEPVVQIVSSNEEYVDKSANDLPILSPVTSSNFKSKKEEATKETRSNSKTRVKKDLVKLSDIPFEVKKLLYSAQCILDKDDLLSTLELASNDSKRNLRQLAPRSKVLQVSDKKSRELDDESNGSKDTSKKEKIEANKKSSRKNAEKKGDDKLAKTSLEKDSTSNAIANIAQNERNQQGKKDRTVKTKEIMVDNPEMKSKTDGRQTRGSMSDVKNEPSLEIVSDNLRKDKSLLGKRRSRNKSLDKDEVTNFRASKAQSGSENASSSGKEAEKELGEVIDKISKKEIETESDKNSDDRLDSTVVNINLSHLQSETSNLSIDSGKENSLETSVNVHSKLKVGRPKKSWGARREKSLRRRSLNNVIGILTEGMNIPVEAQQNVQVLTVQTSLDNPDRLARNGSVQQPSSGEGNMIDSAFSELSVLTKSEEKSTENEIVTATSTTDSSHADDKKNACPDEAQLENAFADGKVDVSLKVATAKACSPANDIILDLSRRKPKGKGSFLEKIVSKIAKQKDALLEGEVGSLLDTAADELTSILDEVGPTLTDNTESTNSNEANHASKNDKNVTVTFTDKELPMIVDSEVQALENEKISVESAVSKRSTDSLEIADNISDVEMKNNDDLDRKVSSVEENVESCEKKSMTNEEPIIPIKIPNESSSSLTDTSISCSLIMTQKENLEKPERKKGVTKSRRKSNKKSLDARSKKNKKRLLEIIEDCTEEDAQKKLGLNDTFKSDIGNEFSKKDDKITCENAKLMADLEKSLDKIISDEDITNDQSIESTEKNIDFSILSSEKSVECRKSTNRNKKKNQVNSNGSSSRRKSKRKSKSVLSITSPMDVTTNILETSIELMDETEKIPSSLSTLRESLELTDMQSIKTGTTSDSDTPLENILHAVEIAPEKRKETQNTDSENLSLVNSMSSKTTKKRGAKKKSLAEEHLELPEDKSTKIVSKFNDESSIADTNEQLSVSLEHFKIPEVKDLPQSAKKRSPKKKLQSEEDRWNSGNVSEESQTNEEPMVIGEISNSIEEKVKEQEEIEKHVTGEESNTKKFERSSSSGSIGLAPFLPKTRSMFKRKTQLSSEDLADCGIRNQSAESMDDLSESSCVSESSYFRKKRFAKKKRKEEMVVGSARADSSLIDSIALKSGKQSPKEKTSKSLLDEHLDLSDVDDIDIPMDIQASLENTEALEKIERELELTNKSLDPQNEDSNKLIDDTENKDSDALERPASNNHDSSDNPVTPKKRTAGNFVVVHTKTGEILIVEKKKKLTKETPKFFCGVCATSFTRKSSLKKHTLSQSHLSQLTKSTKDKIESVNSNTFENTEEDDNEWKSNQENDQQTKNVLEDAPSHETDRKSLELDENFVPYTSSTEVELTKSLVDLGTRQMLEDKLLDEEICKITENMSHDEYVLTDQLTPEEPMLSSTPIKAIQTKQEDSGRSKNNDKKRNKSKKRNLAEEHLLLDSPKLENSKIDSSELSKPTNDVQVSSPSCDYSSMKEIMEIVEKTGDISKECVDNTETENQSELIVKSLNEETDLKSVCDTDRKADQQTESTRTTKKTSRKVSKAYNEEKEETSALTEINRFSLRPRRSKNIQHYEESDIEADIFFMDTSTEMNSDEKEDSCDVQKRQNEVKETNRDALQENAYVATDDKSPQNTEVANLTTDSTNSTKKKKRGRPRLKDRIVPNSSNTSASAKLEVNGNDSVATSNLDESKIEDQKLNLHTKERLDKISKPPHIDANAQPPPKRSRGRPRKNPVPITNSSVQADNSSASELTKSNYDEVKEKADVIESCSKMVIEESTSIKTNTCVDDAKCVLEDKRNDTNVNVLVHLTTESSAELPSQIIEQVSIDDLESAESKAIELDNNESFEIPKSTNILEEEQMKPREQLFEEEVPKAKILLGSESEDKTLTADNKPVLNFHESQKILNDSGNDSTYDEKTIRRESNKKLSRKSTSKERETDRKRLKTSKDKKKKIKVAELSSDSENEDDRIESAASSKSKIVKSVFGRVFGGEKADKVKEVLNDWVSRSEDDSDISKNALDARSYLRGLTKFPENGHKKEKKCHFGSETKKDTERLHRKKGNDKESKTKAGERIWRAFDNEISSCLSDDQDLNEFHEISKEQRFEFDESKDLNRLENNSKNVKQTDDDTWKDVSSIDQEQSVVHSGRGRSRKNSNSRKKQNFNIIKISKSKTNKRISKDHESSIPLEDRETKNEMQNDQTILSTNESRTRSKTLIKDSSYESIYGDLVVSKHVKKDGDNLLTYLDQSTNSKKNKKGIVNEDWKHSARKFDLDDDQLTEKNIGQKGEESTISSRSCSSLAAEEPIMKNQLVDLDGNSQMNRNDNDDNNDNDDEEEDNDSDLERQRLSPFARETPNNFIESSSNNEEEEEEEEEDGEEEEERVTYEDNSRKTNPSEFSGEKIIIRSPSLGHRSDVVTIAPTDAMEDNALDVPREIEEPTTEPRQGKILNFDEELFVECCSRLKATSENELRGAKKIKLDHSESYHRRDDQPQDFRVNRDRWRDVESQNSLGSLLESVNQLLGEEMYNSHDKSYRMHGSERSSRSASPDASRIDNLGYEDSLDVAFEHNNKLRDKIQQRMRESENLIASTFGQKINDRSDDKRDSVGNSYSSSIHEHEQLPTSIASNRELGSSPGHKNKMNSTLGGLHKALSNLLHSNGKHDHNGSAPMKLLAELACARAPTSTLPEDTTNTVVVDKDTPTAPKKPMKDSAITSKNSPTKKTRNPIKELFERKKEINDRRQQQRSKGAFVELNVQKQRKSKKSRKQQQEFPLIRRSEHYGGLVEKKKRRDSLDRKGESERIKDVYEFDEEESQMAPTLGSVMSYRSQIDKNYDINWSKIRNTNGNLDTVLQNGKTNYVANTKLDAVINRKFQELEKFAPKTKGALKSFQSEEQQQQQQQITEAVTGPMDEFVERKQRMKRSIERSNEGIKQSGKIKKRGKSSKKRVRNAWYENDSSDEFRTAAKTEDVGVGISKSQRSCSKGKQNLFAELSTSSESEYERDNIDYMTTSEQRSKSKKSSKKPLDDVDETDAQRSEPEFDNEDQVASDWNRAVQEDAMKNDHDVAKSESEMSDHSLVIDERKMIDEGRNSEDDADNQYERTFDLDDLYREDSSDEETEVEENEEPTIEEVKNNRSENQTLDENATLQTKLTSTITKNDCASEMISLEEALDFLDRHENLDPKAEDIRAKNNIINGTMDEVSNDGIINEEMENKCSSPTEMRDEKEEPDDDVPTLPEKLSSNEKPLKESDHNLPLHVFLSRKVQESKKRKQQQLDKLREEQERILMDFQPTRRQRKCAIGKQGLLAEISSSDEESYVRDKDSKKGSDHDKSRKKRELKEKRKERYLEKKHEQMIAKEQKAIEEEILREVGKRKEIIVQNDDIALNTDVVEAIVSGQIQRKKHQTKEKHKKSGDESIEENAMYIDQSFLDNSEDNHDKSDRAFSTAESNTENNDHLSTSLKRKKLAKSSVKSKKVSKSENGKIPTSKRSKEPTAEKSKKSTSNKDSKERRSSSGKRDSDDEELKTTKSWNKVEEGVGVAIGRHKRTAALQLYYWSSSSDEEEAPEPIPAPEEEEDDRQEQHGWIVGDSHKKMITMLAMEKQLKEKRRRSEDEFEPGKAKSKKHRNSTS
ncbi:hypothetical protein ALC62_14560 [Cyphomyrmex costatus]|uniref:C2H2-type domain-containing protein n=1 Tax=Cyphomyrmex costatus TaxID=456900 RepID=A0A195C2Z4_9HYME|nr:hypothetical protein ALC62_14560 [Cyphomyrmex costatus]